MKYLRLVVLLLLSACGTNEKTDVMFECASPSGARIATVYRVANGDRPGDQEMRINVRPAAAVFNDGMHSFSFRHGYDAIVSWQSDQDMRIEYPADSEITHQETVIFGTSQTFDSSSQIRVDYQDKPSTHGYFVVEKRCFTGDLK